MAVVLITDNGPHPPAKWALATAEHICPIDRTLVGERRSQAEKLQADIAAALLPHHAKIQETERENLINTPDHITTPHNVEDYANEAMLAIQKAAIGTPWDAHYNNPEVIKLVKFEIGTHFETAQHIERLWHADRNPENPTAQAYKSQFHPPELSTNENPLALN